MNEADSTLKLTARRSEDDDMDADLELQESASEELRLSLDAVADGEATRSLEKAARSQGLSW